MANKTTTVSAATVKSVKRVAEYMTRNEATIAETADALRMTERRVHDYMYSVLFTIVDERPNDEEIMKLAVDVSCLIFSDADKGDDA